MANLGSFICKGCDFNIDLSLLTPKSEYFAKLINMNHLFYEKLKDDLIATKVIQELADFTTISDRHIEKHAGEILLRYCYLKSLLFLSSKTQDEALLDMFKSYTNSREYLEEHPHSKQIEQLIDEGFTEVLTKKKELKEHKN